MIESQIKDSKTPKHVAIVMDGNARWAKSQGVMKSKGHKAGAENAKKIALHAKKVGVEYLTLYAFSHENWNRPKSEVKLLMGMIKKFLDEDAEEIMSNGICLSFIGDLGRLDKDLRDKMLEVSERSKNNKFHLILAISYGARDEIKRATIKFAEECIKLGRVDNNLADNFDQFLDTKGIPDPDLFVRTSGEVRVSNFLLWQISYAELYFTEIFWPAFNEDEFDKAIECFAKRDRRFGAR